MGRGGKTEGMTSELGMKEWMAKADVALASIWHRVTRTDAKRPSPKLARKFSLEPPASEGRKPREPALVPTPSLPCLRSSCEPTDLKHAKRRIRLARDFDAMLEHGFPTLTTLLNRPSAPEYTLYISLTPKIAQPMH